MHSAKHSSHISSHQSDGRGRQCFNSRVRDLQLAAETTGQVTYTLVHSLPQGQVLGSQCTKDWRLMQSGPQPTFPGGPCARPTRARLLLSDVPLLGPSDTTAQASNTSSASSAGATVRLTTIEHCQCNSCKFGPNRASHSQQRRLSHSMFEHLTASLMCCNRPGNTAPSNALAE